MNSRAVVAVAVAMLAALAVAAVSQDSDADVQGSMSLEIGDAGSSMLIHFSESQYDREYYYTLQWGASIGGEPWIELGSRGLDGAYSAPSPVTLSGGGNGLEVALAETSTLGTYTLSARSVDGVTSAGTIHLALRASVEIYGNVSDTEPLAVLDPLFYNIDVTVTVPGDITIGNVTEGGEAGTMVFTQYTNVAPQRIIANMDGTDVVGNYSWYAQGLPAGLSMSSDGWVTGFPVEPTPSEGVTVSLVATSADGAAHQAPMTVIVLPYEIPDYSGNRISIQVTSGQAGSGSYAVTTGDEFTFIVSFTVDGQPVDAPIHVAGVDSDGQATYLQPDSEGTYDADTSGTGRYVITATAVHDGVQYVDLLYLDVNDRDPSQAYASIVVESSEGDFGEDGEETEGGASGGAPSDPVTHYVYGDAANLLYPFYGEHPTDGVSWTITPYGEDTYTASGDRVTLDLRGVDYVTVTQTVQRGDSTDSETIVIRAMHVMDDDDRTYTIAFVSEGEVVSLQTIDADDMFLAGDMFFAIPDDPARDGYRFLGWYSYEGSEEVAMPDDLVYVPVESDMEFHARWSSETGGGGDSPGGSQTVVVDRTRVVTFDTQPGLEVIVTGTSGRSVSFTIGVADGYHYIDGSYQAVANGGRMTSSDGVFTLSGVDRSLVVTVTGDRLYSVSYLLSDGSSVEVQGYSEPPSLVPGGALSMTVSGAGSVSVLMDGVDITAQAVSGSSVSIPEVTGNVTVMADWSSPSSGDDGGFPWWLILVIVILLAVIAVLAYMYHRKGRETTD